MATSTPLLLALIALLVIALVVVDRRRRGSSSGLQIAQIDRLREAELALANAVSTEAAAHQLAEHAIALLGAASATVIIEGIGDTVRVSAGEPTSVYGTGSRMRLLDDDGVPCGSIAVSARADGRGYTAQQEHMLDALAQRVSSTLHRLSLFTEIQVERRTLADVVGSSSDGIFSVGPDQVVRSWNPAMAAITGVSATMAVGHAVSSVFRVVDEEGRPVHGGGSEAEVALVRLDRSDAEWRWLTCSWSPLTEGGYVVVARDETERKQLQDDKDGWIAQVSHELRTPLTPIRGFLHTLQRRERQLSAPDRQRIYDVMLREEQRLENLVNGLLQATTMNAGHVAVDLQDVDWRTLVADQVDLYRRSDPDRSVLVVVEPGLERVVTDAALASGVVANLLSNALKYSPAGSPIEVRSALEGDDVVTTVTDCGPGVPKRDRERIFEKFTRLGDHLTRPQQGIGLGLYIARQAVEQLGGEIWCDARPGGGARFGFRLPVGDPAEVAPVPVAEVPVAAAPPRGPRRVLTAR
ncbi:MAG TPA: ATP-binding protein [Acidimicrobiales bacterium]|nr:ATP-binding protein [Acidimicrobiales bacterium]